MASGERREVVKRGRIFVVPGITQYGKEKFLFGGLPDVTDKQKGRIAPTRNI